MTFVLTHSSSIYVKELGVFDGISSIHDMIRSIVTQSTTERAIEIYENVCRMIQDEEENLEVHPASLKFRGESFEVFVEFFLKYFENDVNFGLSQYTVTDDENDYGVDGSGLDKNGDRTTVQVKFKQNTQSLLTYRYIATFIADSFENWNVDSNHMLLVTTSRGVNWVVEKRFPNLARRVIGYNQLSNLCDDNPKFWQELRDSVNNAEVEL